MRIVSTTHAPRQAPSVAAVDRARTRMQRDGAVMRENGGVRRKEAADATVPGPARTPRKFLQADPATVGIGLTVQNMFHSQNGMPAEENIIRAADAYARSENIRLAGRPFALRVA